MITLQATNNEDDRDIANGDSGGRLEQGQRVRGD